MGGKKKSTNYKQNQTPEVYVQKQGFLKGSVGVFFLVLEIWRKLESGTTQKENKLSTFLLVYFFISLFL